MPQLRNHSIVRKASASSTAIVDDWRDQSACRDADPETFFPAPSDTAGIAEALNHCAVCPVKQRCLQYAISTRQEYGVWGGLSENEVRERIGLARLGRKTSGCGSEAGWRVHRAKHTEPCQPCQDAHTVWLTEDRRRRLNQEHEAAGGTAYGFTLHHRLGETPCPLCVTAETQRRAHRKERARTWAQENADLANSRRRERRAHERQDRDTKCGTYAGYKRHKRAHEPACEACETAYRDYTKAAKQRARDGLTQPRNKLTEEQARTIAARKAAGEIVLDLAAEYGVSESAIYRAVKRHAPDAARHHAPCGTYAAYMRHQRHNEPACDPCRDAYREYRRAQSKRARAGQSLPRPRKVTDEQHAEIARRKAAGENANTLAVEYGVAPGYIRQIARTAA